MFESARRRFSVLGVLVEIQTPSGDDASEREGFGWVIVPQSIYVPLHGRGVRTRERADIGPRWEPGTRPVSNPVCHSAFRGRAT